MDFDVTEGDSVDLLEPFPLREVRRIFGWSRPSSLGSIIISDQATTDKDEFVAGMNLILAASRSFAIVDKNHTVSPSGIPAPLVGVIIAEPDSPWNAYMHIAARSKAAKLVREASKLAINRLFETEPGLLRLSARIADGNKPAKYLARRAGLRQDGKMSDWATVRGEPITVVHFGLTRRSWKQWDSLQDQSSQDSAPSEPEAPPLEPQISASESAHHYLAAPGLPADKGLAKAA